MVGTVPFPPNKDHGGDPKADAQKGPGADNDGQSQVIFLTCAMGGTRGFGG